MAHQPPWLTDARSASRRRRRGHSQRAGPRPTDPAASVSVRLGNLPDTPSLQRPPSLDWVKASLPVLRSFLSGVRAGGWRLHLKARAVHWLDPSRPLGDTSASSTGMLDPALALALMERLRQGGLPTDVERMGGQVQRLGERAWKRILKRWPALAPLVAEPVTRAVRQRRTGAATPAPAVTAPTNGAAHHDEAAIDVLVLQLVAASTWQSRLAAAETLALQDGEGVFEALRHALRDPSVEVAVAAVEAIAQRQAPAARAALQAVVENRDGYFSPMTRVAAISALGPRLLDDELEPIIACVRDLDAEVSIAAIAVLADRKSASAATPLLPVLTDPSGYFLPVVRLAAANALAFAGALTPDLATQLLQHEQSEAVHHVLARAAQRPPAGD
jgi:hypothetical protein